MRKWARQDNRIIRPVAFNLDTEKDEYEWSKKINFSGWVKSKIKEELENGNRVA